MKNQNAKRAGLWAAALLGVVTWFLGGIISAGTGQKRRR